MKQVFYHYTEWEDFKSGMYNEDKNGREERVREAVVLLSSLGLCREQMTRVTHEWRRATEQNLTNPSINYQAFLGQAACAIWRGIHEDETREAWGRLTDFQRYAANKVADAVYAEWRERYERETEPFWQMSLFEVTDEKGTGD